MTYDQIVSVVDAVKTAPTLSGAVLCRNLLDHNSPTKTIPVHLKQCVKRHVYTARKDITKKQLDGYDLNDSFGSLTVFAEINLFSTLMRKHNDLEDAAHYLWIRVDDPQRLSHHHSRLGISIEWRHHG